MPILGNNPHTLLQGLSDFWTRFYADTAELEAMYGASEIAIAQAYLDMLSSFLNISVNETPIFNTEYFKLLTAREDNVTFDVAAATVDDRHLLDMPGSLVEAKILQNKVIDPTASLETDINYDLDLTDYGFRFKEDPTGYPGRVLGTTTHGTLLTYNPGQLTRLYAPDDEAPFTAAKVGNWLRLTNSGSGNNSTYLIGKVESPQAVLIQGNPTLPDVNDGSLVAELLDSEFSPVQGFAHRIVTVPVGGSFDDPLRRSQSTRWSWYADNPVGLSARKGDVLRILDRRAVPTVPSDYVVSLVRHDKVYVAATPRLPITISNIEYTLLRATADADITHDPAIFAPVNVTNVGGDGSLTDQGATETRFSVTAAPFVAGSKHRYLTIANCGPITWTASLDATGKLSGLVGMSHPLARAFVGGTVNFNGTEYTISSIVDNSTAMLEGTGFTISTGTASLVGVTNGGTFRIKTVLSASSVVLDLVASAVDVNNGALSWTLHDGLYCSLSHGRLEHGTLVLRTGLGNYNMGGFRRAVENVDYQCNYETGLLQQIGRMAGEWGQGSGGSRLIRTVAGTAADWIVAATHEVHAVNAALTDADLNRLFVIGSSTAGNNGAYTILSRSSTQDAIVHEAFVADENNAYLSGTDGIYEPISQSSPSADYRWYAEILPSLNRVVAGNAGDSIAVATRRIVLVNGAFTDNDIGKVIRVTHSTVNNNLDFTIESRVNSTTVVAVETPIANESGVFLSGTDGIYWVTGSVNTSVTEALVNEVAFWAPDAKVDKYHLYNTYGHLINRFRASSEAYKQFIRGIFQLYILGPTLERIESALNVIANFPVIRDDGETFVSFDDTSDVNFDLVNTRRPNGEYAVYAFPKATTSIVRADVRGGTVTTFESFEALTSMFYVSDTVQDPTWWDSIIVPINLLPGETMYRRTVLPVLFENVIGAIDGPEVGDPGLFVGADDEGNIR